MVIPVINETNFEEIKRKIKLIEPYCEWVQIDIADGIFTPNKTWQNSSELADLQTFLNIELHLMVLEPEKNIEEWLKISAVKRVIVHLEGVKDFEKLKNLTDQYQKELGLAINPETSWEILKPYLEKINFVQILAVKPGLAGQKFNPQIIEKIKALKNYKNDVILEVDGGITPENAHLLKALGVDILNSSTYIFNSRDIKEAINSLDF